MIHTSVVIFGAIALGSISAALGAPIIWELDLEARGGTRLSPRGISASKYVEAGSVNLTPEKKEVVELAELRGRRATFWAQREAVVAAGRDYPKQLAANRNVVATGNSAGVGLAVALAPGATTRRHLILSTSINPQHVDQNPPTEHRQ